MSSCQTVKSNRVLRGLATLAITQMSISARPSSIPRSLIPIRSKTVAIPASKSATLSSAQQSTAAVATSSSLPKKTEESIMKHVERLRQTRARQAVYQTSNAFKKPEPVDIGLTKSRPVSHLGSRVPSTSSSSSSNVSSRVARTEKSIEAHVVRIRSRGGQSPTISARHTPQTSRKVTPICQLAPLRVVKRAAAVNFAKVDEELARLTVTSLRSCLKTPGVPRPARPVSFINANGWLMHDIRAYDSDDHNDQWITLTLDNYLDIYPDSRPSLPDEGVYQPGYRLFKLAPGKPLVELRLPDGNSAGPMTKGPLEASEKYCVECCKAAGVGTPHTRYRPNQQSIMCKVCMTDVMYRHNHFHPALEDEGEDDHLDTCQDGQHWKHDTCQYLHCSFVANHRWLVDNFPSDYTH